MTDVLRLHNIVYHTRTLGPGDRTAIWFQGCRRRCKGCMSESSRPMDGGWDVSIPKLCSAILQQTGIEGVTISGGEPFLQAEALYTLISGLRSKSNLGVIVYTGYTIEPLKERNDLYINRLLDGMIDLLIDGEYVDELNDGKSLRGSSNQRVLLLTERYTQHKADYEQQTRDIEVYMKDNEVFLIGIPSNQTWKQWESVISDL